MIHEGRPDPHSPHPDRHLAEVSLILWLSTIFFILGYFAGRHAL